MVEDIVTTDETIEINDEVESFPSHPYDLPGEWFVLNAHPSEIDLTPYYRTA